MKLTDEQRRLRAMTEKEWQAQVTELAEALSYSWCHWRPAQTKHGWRTPCEGPLGKGFPDLLLAKPGRLLFVELKREKDHTSEETRLTQEWVGAQLKLAGAEHYTWRPSDFDQAVKVLNG